MKYETLAIERDGAVMTMRMNRPDKRNAINRQMHRDIQQACLDLADDFETRVVIFAGEGAAFSAGADTSEWGMAGPDNELELRSQSGIGSRTSAALENLDQISIAAVHGFAVGGAVVFASACDFRVGGRDTWLSIPEIELGIPLSWNALPRLARIVGHAKALELTVLCERFSAQQALDYGLLTHLADENHVMETAQDIAEKVIKMPALPVAMTKATMKALRKGTEAGEAAYSDPDLLLYSRLMQQRRRRRGTE